MKTFPNVFEPSLEEVTGHPFHLQSCWRKEYFKNNNPLVIELGCGRGEYTVGLARMFPEKNFIGVDIKGARMWQGAKQAMDQHLPNVAFVRTRIEFIRSFFGSNEVDEIWLTFPDPQEKKRRAKKRLTGSLFLNMYKEFLKKDGLIHLKTDNALLYTYTLNMIQHNKLDLQFHTDNLYRDLDIAKSPNIRTYYEELFLTEGKSIHYLRFLLDTTHEYTEPSE